TLDGRLVALDAKTGTPVWTVDTVADKSKPYSITGAPRVVKNAVLIGNGGADRGVRGYLTAYDSQTGAELWRFWVVPKGPNAPPENDDVARAAQTWPADDDSWTDVGGGTPWDAMAYDHELDHPRGPHHRRHAAQSAVPSAEERLLLRARPRHRRAARRGQIRRRELG